MLDYSANISEENENEPPVLLEQEQYFTEVKIRPTTKKDVADSYDNLNPEKLIADKKTHDNVMRLRKVRDCIDELTSLKNDLEDSIATYMQDRESLITMDGEELVNWRFNKPTQKFNERLFKVENQEIYNQYLEQKPGNRTFLLKNRGE